jgi:phage terminase large subunit
MLERRGLLDKEIVADSAEPRAIAKLRKLGVRRIRPCYKADGWMEAGMNFLRASKMRIVIDARPHMAKKAWDEFSRYEFARYKNGDLKTGYPDADNHWIDAGRYGCESDIRKAYKPKQWSLPQGYERRYAQTA